MKLSLGRASTLALALGSVAVVATSACADSETLGEMLPSDDAGAPTVVPGTEVDAAPAPVPDASVEAGPKTCSDHGFCPTAVPDGRTVKSLWGDGTGILWAATQEGDVLRWDGSTWKVHASDLGALNVIWGSGPTDVWVGGEGGLQHGTGPSSDALSFAAVTLPGDTTPISSIWGLSANEIWAVGTTLDMNTFEYVGRAFRFVGDAAGPDAGADAGDAGGAASGHWELHPVSSSGVRFTRVWGTAAGGVWLGGGKPMLDMPWVMDLAVLHDAGDGDFVESTLPLDPDPDVFPWEKESTITGAFVSSKTSLTIWAQPVSVFSRPSVWRGTSTDDGKTFTFTWAKDDRPAGPPVHTVVGAAANDVWAAGDYGRLMHWNGSKWSTTAISLTGYPVKDPFFSLWAAGPNDVWVGGKAMALRFDPTKEKNGGVE